MNKIKQNNCSLLLCHHKEEKCFTQSPHVLLYTTVEESGVAAQSSSLSFLNHIFYFLGLSLPQSPCNRLYST